MDSLVNDAPTSTDRTIGATAGADRPDAGARPADRDAIGRIAAWRPRSTSRLLVLLAVAFVASRLVAGAITQNPVIYGFPEIDPGHDIEVYAAIAGDALDEGQSPYRDQGISYPPGSMAAILPPEVAAAPLHTDYRTAFVGLMVIVDALGALALALIGRRTGWWHGLVAWVVVVPLLGPLAYSRFDLLPAVLTLWALERALAGRWWASAAFLGANVATKVYGVFLLPQAWVVAPRRSRVVLGAAAGAAVLLAPFVLELPTLGHVLFTDQGQRGLHWESTWGSLVLSAHFFLGYPVQAVSAYGGVDLRGGVSDTLTGLSSLVSIGVVLVTARRCATVVRRGDAGAMTLSMFGTLALLLGLGSVYSPQYVLWAVALGAAALAMVPAASLRPFSVLIAVVVLSHLVYPVFWLGLAEGDPASLLVLLARNGLTIVTGVLALRALPGAAADERHHVPQPG